ncbi:uncharacterized protein ARB_03709 [Trichophyton benhamiae CBS 112371]|uniref:60S ribosomal protein L13 n=1 Tax=Arthroderma benhamiae (strain ATCC MYA-4681 / CBS 112371) TaxID=663331 RepID=D4B5G9_ARTBC|nr:uncharacterized protein ARB_03709 [Trichophyton benhamiae CBS 112371]EFE29413.1 hypothetical protein ARB_03709 [Trichophyton benhamiae CBS 112371]
MKREERKPNGWEARDKQKCFEEEVELLLVSDRRLGKQLDNIATPFLIRVVLNRLPQGLGPTCQSTFRPVDKLRPIVRCPTIKYNSRVRAGRGFSLQELKEAGIPRKLAPTIGITVDHRRGNVSAESLSVNVARLKAYKARLILFPRKSGQFKKLDSSAEEIKAAKEGLVKSINSVLPVTNPARENAVSEIKKSDLPSGEENAYRRMRIARSDARLVGVRAKRAKAKAEEAAAAKK